MKSVRIINKSSNPLPSYATPGAAGMDLRAWLPSPVEILPMERAVIPTGIFMEIPEGFEAQIRPRSGLAIKSGIMVVNAPGTIDSDYRGEIKIGLLNTSKEKFTIRNGDRIAQLIFAPVQQMRFESVDQLSDTERADGGFGHSGLQ